MNDMAMILHLNKVAHFILVITSIIQVKVLVPITMVKVFLKNIVF